MMTLITKYFRAAAVLSLCALMATAANSQYLHRNGKDIVNGENKPLILRGMGLGGWMLQEGYMLETNSFANPQHEIRSKISQLVGESNTQAFYEAWRKNHCTRTDIDSLASWGFNSVRLPMHYNLFTLPIEDEPVPGGNTWLEKGFAMTDSLLKWCAANQIYLILDLHAAPGGQGNDAAISDYDNSKPSLWQSDANKQKTIALWRKLAERYANEPWIGGYDLINETNWNFDGTNKNGCDESVNAPLKLLLDQITKAIREVDKNHIIFIEGNCWANNHNGLLPFSDDNTALSFHKYWSYNDVGSIQGMIDKRNQYDIPLWLGETGENSNVWFTSAIRLMESNNIGWAWWPMKKVGSVVNPLTVVKNDGYEKLLNYWKNGGVRPSDSEAVDALMQLAENLKIGNNIFRKDVIDAMFRQTKDNTATPFKKLVIPGVVHASDYDLGRLGTAYFDLDTGTYHVSNGGSYTAWNSGWAYRNDGVDLESNTDTDPQGNGYSIGWAQPREWTQYTVNTDSSAGYNVEIRYASTASAVIRLTIDGQDMVEPVTLASTGGHGIWKTFALSDVILDKGDHVLRVLFEKGSINLSYLAFKLSKKVSEIPLRKVGAITDPEGKSIKLILNKAADESTLATTGFSLKANGTLVSITLVNLGADATELVLTPATPLEYGDVLLLSYEGNSISSLDGFALERFTDATVFSTMPFHHLVPGQVQAEDFSIQAGLQLETTTDIGGGQNIGYTTIGDFLEYRIFAADSGRYKVEARVASESMGGTIEIQQHSITGALLNSTTLAIPVTGGWQTWKTVDTQMTLDDGSSVLKVLVTQPEFNINWFRFTSNVITGVERSQIGEVNIYPNPTGNTVMVTAAANDIDIIRIRDIMGKVVSEFYNHKLNEGSNDLDISSLPQGTYIIELLFNGERINSRLVKCQ
jgi:endoglucanase